MTNSFIFMERSEIIVVFFDTLLFLVQKVIINDFELSQRENRESIGMGVYLAPSILVATTKKQKNQISKAHSKNAGPQLPTKRLGRI